MAQPGVRIAELDEPRLNKLRTFEKSLGGCVVAVEPETKFARLPVDKLKQLQGMEEELGVVLLAYKCE